MGNNSDKELPASRPRSGGSALPPGSCQEWCTCLGGELSRAVGQALSRPQPTGAGRWLRVLPQSMASPALLHVSAQRVAPLPMEIQAWSWRLPASSLTLCSSIAARCQSFSCRCWPRSQQILSASLQGKAVPQLSPPPCAGSSEPGWAAESHMCLFSSGFFWNLFNNEFSVCTLVQSTLPFK